MSDDLYISLGHNSSAISSRDGVVRRGYEQERLDRRKSSSAYPKRAIDRALGKDISCDTAYVSHWFDHFNIEELPSDKYLDFPHLASVANNIVSLSEELTHHDAHARSAVAFARGQGVPGPMRVLVLDGFGNRQECFSAYDVYNDSYGHVRIHRTYGYDMSLGLMYQYVTEFLGFKPNQDEYKLLGYESHVTRFISKIEAMDVAIQVQHQARHHATIMLENTFRRPHTDGLIDYDALSRAKAYWFDIANGWVTLTNKGSESIDGRRACVAFCAQKFLEATVVELITSLPPFNVDTTTTVLTGGSFYNVKLNRTVQKFIGGRVFSHPLAGDQGAAMGLVDVSPQFSDLCIGERPMTYADKGGVLVVSQACWYDVVADMLDSGRVVNVVRGAMEFGPRALCHTTTFALPTLANVMLINRLNERNEAMPMAPVMTREAAMTLLDNSELNMVRRSDGFMITTCAFKKRPSDDLMGVAHRDPIADLWTARPQVTDDPEVVRLLGATPDGVLINTSFNYHGEPIVFSFDDIVQTHSMQMFRAKTLGLTEPVTVVVRP